MAWQQLKHLPVHSQSGEALGQIEGFIFDPETHAIVQYEVRQGLPLARRTLLVAASQVVSISAERMVVEDLAGRSGQLTQAQPVAATETPIGGLAASRKMR